MGVYDKIVELSQEPLAREKSIAYVAENLGKFLKLKERVLICFPEHKEGNISWIVEQAIQRCGAVPVLLGEDHRWKNILRTAFLSRASTVIGPPMIILGLTKLEKAEGVPLFVRNAVTAGYPCLDWMIDGIRKGFDCQTWGCFGLDTSGVVAGFSCGRSRGVHLRSDAYTVQILDEQGNLLPEGECGEIHLYPNGRPDLRYGLGERARLETVSCACGSQEIRLMDMAPDKTEDPDLRDLGQYLQSWTSILDCRLNKGEYGLEIEIIVFPGEKLPKLPSAARLVVRAWNPEMDEPFPYEPALKNSANSPENH